MKRSTEQVRVREPVKVQKPKKGAGREEARFTAPTETDAGLPPSMRDGALRGLLDSPDSGLNADDFGVSISPTGQVGHSPALSAMLADSQLATAYAAGIVLFPSGCVYSEGAEYTGPDPLLYQTWSAYLSPAVFGRTVRALSSGLGEAFFDVWIRTPGSSDDTLTYLLELCVGQDPETFLCVVSSNYQGGWWTSSTTVRFSPTEDEFRSVALVELPGSGSPDEFSARMTFKSLVQDRYEMNFMWLNMMAL
ncbi:MAG: hypothetical protein GF393_04125 [Armatimonadia bacterium]|nr:hypothetical protein [Armatimonadia bacterium]